jgi:hypothetical protein
VTPAHTQAQPLVAASTPALLIPSERTYAMAHDAPQSGTDGVAIRSFHTSVPESELTDLRTRIKATKFPDKETVSLILQSNNKKEMV